MIAQLPKLIALTGVTSGCGRALLQEFAAAGHRVAGCARSVDKIKALEAKYGEPHHFSVLDVADANATELWAQEVLSKLGTPDFVINNAALMNQAAPFWEIPAEEFNQLMDVNVGGTSHVMRAFLPALIERGAGVVVNFSSGWGRSTSPEVAPYCASKWAVEGLSQAVAQEVPTGVAVVALNPGIINTPMLQKCWADGADAYPTPEQWARTAAPYILQLTSRHNGQALSVA